MTWIRDMFHGLRATAYLTGCDASEICERSRLHSLTVPHLELTRELCFAACIFDHDVISGVFRQLYYSDNTSTQSMASPNDRHLCNGIPVDHRLKRFLPSAKQKHSHRVGKHVDIIENFGIAMVRDNGTIPKKHEAGFAAWLAKPDMTGGLVIALQQPAKSQDFTADVERVRDECDTLAYLDKSLTFVNGPGGLKTTNVFDAFPFITEQISSKELSNEATRAYNTFISMVEAKKPEVLFACWRIHGHDDLSFSGKGPVRLVRYKA